MVGRDQRLRLVTFVNIIKHFNDWGIQWMNIVYAKYGTIKWIKVISHIKKTVVLM